MKKLAQRVFDHFDGTPIFYFVAPQRETVSRQSHNDNGGKVALLRDSRPNSPPNSLLFRCTSIYLHDPLKRPVYRWMFYIPHSLPRTSPSGGEEQGAGPTAPPVVDSERTQRVNWTQLKV